MKRTGEPELLGESGDVLRTGNIEGNKLLPKLFTVGKNRWEDEISSRQIRSSKKEGKKKKKLEMDLG